MQIQHQKSLIFKAGLTSKMRQEIASCDIQKISNEFQKHHIQTDFKSNKIVAWCCLNVLEQAKKLNFGLPQGIFVENFKDLNTKGENDLGFCNIAPAKLFKNENKVTSENTLFFNQDTNWNTIDNIADESFEYGINTTDFFLETFIHEFAHSMHENNLLNKMSRAKLLQKIYSINENNQNQKFHNKFDFILSKICIYAISSPFEAVACDLSKRIIENLDKNTLKLNTDFIEKSPYKKQGFFKLNNDDDLSKTIRKFWNGKFL